MRLQLVVVFKKKIRVNKPFGGNFTTNNQNHEIQILFFPLEKNNLISKQNIAPGKKNPLGITNLFNFHITVISVSFIFIPYLIYYFCVYYLEPL